MKEFYETMEENGSDFTNTWRSLSSLSVPGSKDFDKSLQLTLSKLLDASSSLDEIKRAFAPKMDSR